MIIYFSGTGNSRHAANVIAKATGDQVINLADRLRKGDTSPLFSEKPYVFVGPVYAGRYPRVMDEHIEKTNFNGSNKAYFVATCASTPWITVDYVNKLVAKKDFDFQGFNSVLMPQGWVSGGGTQSKEENDRVLAEAKPVIEKIAAIIASGQKLPEEPRGKSIMSTVINPVMYKFMMGTKDFTVSDKCVHCGGCAARCPLANITMKDGKPVWGKNCTQCCACIAGCPVEAIEYGKKSVGKTRYYLSE